MDKQQVLELLQRLRKSDAVKRDNLSDQIQRAFYDGRVMSLDTAINVVKLIEEKA